MIYCVEYRVQRGNRLEDAEWLQEELRCRPRQVEEIAGGYDEESSRGWSLVPRLDQAVWWQRAYGAHGAYGAESSSRQLTARATPVSGAEELPGDLGAFLDFLQELRYARLVLGAGPDDAFYLLHPEPEPSRTLAEDVALLARYALCGRARLLPATRGTAWPEADASWESRAVAGQPSVPGVAIIPAAEHLTDLGAARRLVERLRAAPPRYVDLGCAPSQRREAERLASLLLLTAGVSPQVRET
jgi:hypothetical protein